MKAQTVENRSLKKSSKTVKIGRIKKPFKSKTISPINNSAPSVLMITTFPPRECGIATYSQDLIDSLSRVFGDSISLKTCILFDNKNPLPSSIKFPYSLNPDLSSSYFDLASKINADTSIELIMIQHEFGLFNGCSDKFMIFLKNLKKPVIIGFHTIIPNPDQSFLLHVKNIADLVSSIVVMTESARALLTEDYGIKTTKISIINHGTHLVKHGNRAQLKSKFNLGGKTVLSTFGLLGPGKSIETTLEALPQITARFPEVLFLVLGKTHPSLVKSEGETYRNFLLRKVKELNLESHVTFVNEFLPLEKLLEYLQLTDIYLFTSKDPNQAVSGTFSYAMSCGCPIISTPIPHAKEFLSYNNGLLFDFGNSEMLSQQLKILLRDKRYRNNLGLNGLRASYATSWENSALSHGQLFKKLSTNFVLNYVKPEIKLDHLYKMTTGIGLIQFSKLNQPDIKSGYTLDDNARALIVICETYKLRRDSELLNSIKIYFNFILSCQRDLGTFLNYVDKNEHFTNQNDQVNLEDSNGRAIWAIGHMIAIQDLVPTNYEYFFERARESFHEFLPNIPTFHSPRALGFIIKGMKISGLVKPETLYYSIFLQIGSKLAKMYEHESCSNWKWFEPYLTYGNSVLPEAMLEIYKLTKLVKYKVIAFTSFNFLLQHFFVDKKFTVISNQRWFLKGDSTNDCSLGGQQPIDVAYTILALKNFDQTFPHEGYKEKMELAFSWFMGNNHLKQIIYNPCTTGCCDGLELKNVNLNQGAESTVSYLMARLSFEEFLESKTDIL